MWAMSHGVSHNIWWGVFPETLASFLFILNNRSKWVMQAKDPEDYTVRDPALSQLANSALKSVSWKRTLWVRQGHEKVQELKATPESMHQNHHCTNFNQWLDKDLLWRDVPPDVGRNYGMFLLKQQQQSKGRQIISSLTAWDSNDLIWGHLSLYENC